MQAPSYMTTSGMHRRPFEGRHLVLCSLYLVLQLVMNLCVSLPHIDLFCCESQIFNLLTSKITFYCIRNINNYCLSVTQSPYVLNKLCNSYYITLSGEHSSSFYFIYFFYSSWFPSIKRSQIYMFLVLLRGRV